MEPSMPMILPKGIVINTKNIYQEVASYPIIPADKIWEYWHVYTTTNKKLKDPTARRLENFWWQVWGSDRRYLSGRALAKIYEDISLGPTVVPLHGPPNRWEGPGVPPLTKQLIVAHLSRGLDEPQRPEPPRMRSTDTSIRSLSSSASKPPPSHPILKKTKSPLTTGPKPTARFVSPPDSDDEGSRESDIPSSGSTATTGLEMPPPTKVSLAIRNPSLESTAATKRPALNRRHSPQPPTLTAQFTSRDAAPTATTRGLTQLRTVSPIPERTQNTTGNESEETEDSTSTRSSGHPIVLSAKAAGKQPMVPRAATKDLSGVSQGQPRPSISTYVANSNSKARTSSDLRSPASTRSISLTRTDTDNSSTTGSITDSVSMTGRSLSQNGYARKGSATQSLFTGPLATTTNVAAKGQIIDQAGSLPASGVLDPYVEDASLPSRPSASSLLESRMAPTQPSHAASVPMGRTRSQLTLLLEREKSRISDKPRSKH
ncbi:hypothetical protein VFPPC_04691 [Pochonia chlamydosporia 170]|uniref:Uncharacterized protein n=1 Tax=Pochonia chlamydosporia 170 TaxID=1380566 RepID=A0A179FS55_METCM|nr:hypothetical protein VFPPC_04691 [Pochonia chlamydosporia 170]OAQ68455.1 hypothetical protein VFPPC_04691 [Pochonia chlamydosporia 170]